MKIEYRVRPVTRYVVTRWQSGERHGSQMTCGSSETRGEFDNERSAYEVAYALCKHEHNASGELPGSMNFIYPRPVGADDAELVG